MQRRWHKLSMNKGVVRNNSVRPWNHHLYRQGTPRCAILSLMQKLDSLSNLLVNLLLDTLRFVPGAKVKPRRASDGSRLTLVLLSSLFAWRQALTIAQPDAFIRWHRKGFRLLWRWKSKPRGRPRVPAELQKLIVEMAKGNPTWLRPGKAVGIDCLKGASIRPFVPSDVVYEVGAARQQTVRSPRTMYPHSQGWHPNREETVYLPA